MSDSASTTPPAPAAADVPATLVAALRAARHVAVLTGAGVSAESGIPTFRDAMTGIWARFDAEDLATPDAFRRDRALVWGWYEWRRMCVLKAQPNPAHVAIAGIARHVPRFTLITQNVDDLHERAGVACVVHLHGSLHHPRCFACSRPHTFPAGIPDEPDGGRRLEPPRCTHCGGPVRPGVVWFGEPLPAQEWEQANRAALDCDLLLAVGTSSLVYPAASLPRMAASRGTPVAHVNPQRTSLSEIATWNLAGPAGGVLPAVVGATWGNADAAGD